MYLNRDEAKHEGVVKHEFSSIWKWNSSCNDFVDCVIYIVEISVVYKKLFIFYPTE